MQNSIGRDQSIIPFQNTNIAKVAYEQHLRNQDKREREQYRAEQKAERRSFWWDGKTYRQTAPASATLF